MRVFLQVSATIANRCGNGARCCFNYAAAARRYEEHLVKIKPSVRRSWHRQVAAMDRVERTPKQRDPSG
jgi:diaminopimelate epimerase